MAGGAYGSACFPPPNTLAYTTDNRKQFDRQSGLRRGIYGQTVTLALLERIQSRIPDSELRFSPGVGHSPLSHR